MHRVDIYLARKIAIVIGYALGIAGYSNRLDRPARYSLSTGKNRFHGYSDITGFLSVDNG